MRPTVFIAILAFLALVAGDAKAQEQNIPLSVEGANLDLQRTPSLVVHEVITPQPVKAPTLPAAKTSTAAAKPGATKTTAQATTPSVIPSQPLIFIEGSSAPGEMTSTGNPKYDAMIATSAARNGVDPNLIVAVMRQESGFNLRARSYKGASGLMQLMPATASRFGVTNIFDPAQNIEGGAKYLRFLLDSFNGDVNLVLAGYNAGENAVVNSGYRVPRYRETQNYVKSISARYDATKTKAAPKKSGASVAPSAATFANGRLSNNY